MQPHCIPESGDCELFVVSADEVVFEIGQCSDPLPFGSFGGLLFRQHADAILESLSEGDVPRPEALIAEMGEKHGAFVFVLHRIDVGNAFDGIGTVLGEALDEILERIRHRIPSGPGTVLGDYALEINETVLPDRIQIYGRVMIRSGELSHERSFADPVQNPMVAYPP